MRRRSDSGCVKALTSLPLSLFCPPSLISSFQTEPHQQEVREEVPDSRRTRPGAPAHRLLPQDGDEAGHRAGGERRGVQAAICSALHSFHAVSRILHSFSFHTVPSLRPYTAPATWGQQRCFDRILSRRRLFKLIWQIVTQLTSSSGGSCLKRHHKK